jgi:hypothetical protein
MTIKSNVLLALALAALVLSSGCTLQKPLTTEDALRPGVDQNIQVPPGARLIAFGHYPLAPFVVPHDGGMIYVFDADAARVVFVTSYSPDSTSPTSGDLSQLSRNSFDNTHVYRVYYLPPQATFVTPATSQQSR